jgi:hypothetical protein
MTEHAVVIAGGGPTGLMLAGELALAKVDVGIVERRASQNLIGSRAGGLRSRIIEVLDQHGSAMTPRRPTLTKAEPALLCKLQRGTWRVDELTCLPAHLPADTPTLLVQALQSQLIEVRGLSQANA